MTKAKFIALFFFCLLISIGCVKDYKSTTQTKLVNTTNYTIRIAPYLNGMADLSMQQVLMPNETKIVYERNPWGKTIDPCWGTFLQPSDSTIVSFDNSSRRSKHLKFTADDTSICDYCIPFNDSRNISNEANYLRTITKEEKKYMNGYFTYTFTEQDYLDAKD